MLIVLLRLHLFHVPSYFNIDEKMLSLLSTASFVDNYDETIIRERETERERERKKKEKEKNTCEVFYNYFTG